MKAKLIVEGKEFPIEILDPELQELISPKKKTGYERVFDNESYFLVEEDNGVVPKKEANAVKDNALYSTGNYYTNRQVADNNARADKLMRQLRRFAVEHRGKKLNWKDICQGKHSIYFDYDDNKFHIHDVDTVRCFGEVHFDSEQTAKLAIDTFRDELIWYFTEYKDSL